MRLNPFYDYSAHYWGNHARESQTLCREIIDFLESDTKVESSSQALLTEEWRMRSQDVPRQMTGLHLAAYFGIRDGMQILARKNTMDRRDSHGKTPLSWAAERGHEDIVKLLLGMGKVDIDSQDKNGRTPLSRAVEESHLTITKLLLDTRKVDVDAKDQSGRTPLSWAAQGGSEDIVKLLLDTGKVDVDAKDQSGWTPLSWAAKNGWCSTAKLLVESGADVKGTGGTGWTALLTIMPRVVWQVTNFFWWERKGCCLYCAVVLGEGNIL
jgi:ankyrin repeat protein